MIDHPIIFRGFEPNPYIVIVTNKTDKFFKSIITNGVLPLQLSLLPFLSYGWFYLGGWEGNK
jgi:hypothetical protein